VEQVACVGPPGPEHPGPGPSSLPRWRGRPRSWSTRPAVEPPSPSSAAGARG